MGKLEAFRSALDKSRKIVGFTGAGVSTESGISDYRSKGGLWERFQPVYFEEFLASEAKRVLYWQRKIDLWDGIKNAACNKAHTFFKELYDNEKLLGVITQNIDGLHEKSGLPKERIVNLHGNTLEIICLTCGDLTSSYDLFKRIDLTQGAPLCAKCEGLLKPNTISFGQSLNSEDLEKAELLSLSCDLMIVAGSTLVVHPASTFPALAKRNGATLVIITLSETPLDGMADFVFHEKLGDFLAGF
jgi:NAD-dependent deacetylase